MKLIKTLPTSLVLVLSLCCSCDTATEIKFNSFGTETSQATTEKGYSLQERMDFYKVPGVSIAVVDGGNIRWARGYGMANTATGTKVQPETRFQAGSISKPIAALAVLKLFEKGKVDLDEDVNIYLQDWKIPDSEFTRNEKVTLRRLLTHTAGVTVHGFPGYRQKDSLPSIQMILKGEGNTPAIHTDTVPGSLWRYSGGGYTIVEKVVEDVSGMSFEQYMSENILQPLGMDHSTYEQPLPARWNSIASAAYNDKGEIIEGLWHNYPEQAAAGLWTTPSDLVKYCTAIQEILAGKKDGLLSRETVEMMLRNHMGNWGLGLTLENDGNALRFSHRGKNAGFTNALTAFAYKGHLLVIMTNGDGGKKLIPEIQRSIFNHYQW